MNKDAKSILFILPYPLGKAPSQRFRVEQFLPLLDENGLKYKLATFMDDDTWGVLYKGGSVFQKVWGILMGFLRRWKHVAIDVHRYETVFVHREAAPLGPPVFEWIIAKLWRKKMIYDFDDAIWIPNTSEQNKLAGAFKSFGKVAQICRWSSVVTAGNDFLASFAKESGAKRVVYLPTVVDTHNRYKPAADKKQNDPPVVGWTGSHSTLKYLDELVPVLQELQQETDLRFLVIADRNPELPLRHFEFIKWNEATEIEDLQKIDIGVMPLTADRWSEGKCGFKLIQYMALGIAAVASPVGVNKEIITDEANGFLCETAAEWKERLKILLTDGPLREKMGISGRDKILSGYSIQSQREKFLSLFAGA